MRTLRPWGVKSLVRSPSTPTEPRAPRPAWSSPPIPPFWVNLREWVPATRLTPGAWLRTSTGTHVQITAITKQTVGHQRVHNLTIADTHTYHVGVGTENVLVHNTGLCNVGIDALNDARAMNYKRFASKLTKYRDNIEITLYGTGNVKFEVRVSGRAPGSYAIYRKIVDVNGKTLSVQKVTIAPDGSVVHIKDKM
ncbi:polymorphic toxin-type HINT domain-containing protein [Streptosporangium sp. NPDC004631]